MILQIINLFLLMICKQKNVNILRTKILTIVIFKIVQIKYVNSAILVINCLMIKNYVH